MDVSATTKFVRVSPTKIRDLARAIQGKRVQEALNITAFNKRKAGVLIGKTLKSAVANAENNAGLSAETLMVKEAVVNRGPIMKRYWPRARGMVSPIQRKMSHIKITLSDQQISAAE